MIAVNTSRNNVLWNKRYIHVDLKYFRHIHLEGKNEKMTFQNDIFW